MKEITGIKWVKEIFKKNGYDINFFYRCLRTFFKKIYSKKVRQYTVSKKDLYVFLPYLGKFLLPGRSTFVKTIRDILPCVNLKVVFRIKNRLSSKFTFKEKIPKEMRSLLCYKFQCVSCKATYHGKTKLYFKVRVSEPKILLCLIIVSFEEISVLANETNDFRIKLQENLLIHCDGPQLNKTSESAPLMLFS